MRVKIWAASDDEQHRVCDLADAIADEGLRAHVAAQLRRDGRAWIGDAAAGTDTLITRSKE